MSSVLLHSKLDWFIVVVLQQMDLMLDFEQSIQEYIGRTFKKEYIDRISLFNVRFISC